jgi:uncharacterized hydrophobic protein (TIGR00271 family)
MKTRVGADDIARMREELFYEGADRGRKLSKFWLLLVLAGIIASAGIVGDSTATVIGAMIVAPLMTPILGIVYAITAGDLPNLRRSIILVALGAVTVVAIGYVLGLFIGYDVVAATNSQVASRVNPRLVDLVAAIATGAVGSVALTRSDISDTLPGVAIAISLVPPLAVVGLTLESGAPHQSWGALLLFLTNVCAILATGLIVMWLYGVHRASAEHAPTGFRRTGAVTLIAVLLVAITVPLAFNSKRTDRSIQEQQQVQSISSTWAHASGWTILSVASHDDIIYVTASGPAPEPSVQTLEEDLQQHGYGAAKVSILLLPGAYTPLPST